MRSGIGQGPCGTREAARHHFLLPSDSYLVAGSLARAMAAFHPLASSWRSVYSPVDATVMLA